MGKIVAIAGGDLTSTKKINMHIIELTNKTNPNVLFIGTASNDSKTYIESITNAFEILNCKVKDLSLCTNSYENQKIDDLILWADIIYVGGGDTAFMMQIWKEYDLDKKLKEVYQKDSAVLAGISAGAICWFNCGYSDSMGLPKEDNCDFGWADGMLDIYHLAFCPHYNETMRKSFDLSLVKKDLIGLAMDNNTAFVENNENKYFIKSIDNANAYIIQYKNNKIEKKKIEFKCFN